MVREQRRLAAILSADVVGYSRLMGRDESGTLALLREHRKQRFEPALARHGGRLVKLTGDGALVEFASAVDALSAAIEFQQAMVEANCGQTPDGAIVFRIGLHLGDLIVDGDDLYGDGVNVAARLEAEAPAGGILISGDLHNAVARRLKATFQNLDRLTLKNMEQSIQAFRVEWEPADWTGSEPTLVAPAAGATASAAHVLLPLPDKPSIAVLPFSNMSGDPKQEYFADGMSEDITTALSKFRSLFVIARNSSFAYKGKSPNVTEVGKDLGVRYVLEGSVRRAGTRVRITAQLIEAATGHHVWAEHYDRQVDDIFELQDEITGRIVSTIDVELRDVEAKRGQSRPPGSIGVWEHYHRGMQQLSRTARDANKEARRFFEAAIAADANFAPAHAGLGLACAVDLYQDFASDRVTTFEQGVRYARKAIELDDNDAVGHMSLGRLLVSAGDRDMAIAALEKAIARNPNYASAFHNLGLAYLGMDRLGDALRSVDMAIRLNPRAPGLWGFYMIKGFCHSRTGDHANGIDYGRRAVKERPDQLWPYLILATALARAGQFEEARAQLEAGRRLRADLTLASFGRVFDFLHRDAADEMLSILRKLGLSE